MDQIIQKCLKRNAPAFLLHSKPILGILDISSFIITVYFLYVFVPLINICQFFHRQYYLTSIPFVTVWLINHASLQKNKPLMVVGCSIIQVIPIVSYLRRPGLNPFFAIKWSTSLLFSSEKSTKKPPLKSVASERCFRLESIPLYVTIWL